MIIKQVAKIGGGQDGAVWGRELFRFGAKGRGKVYDLSKIDDGDVTELSETATVTLDRSDTLAPHSNAVFFGKERFLPEDEFPLLYSNIYNNYASSHDPLIGVACVYRLKRDDSGFSTTLVGLIRIGFTDDPELWRAYPDKDGVRPYGNFVYDAETDSLCAFVMRNEELGTRYFTFDMPKICDGEWDPQLGVRVITLKRDDIKDYFDCPYHRYIQGAIAKGGRIYSTEGFNRSEINRPAIRVIDLKERRQTEYVDLLSLGFELEPELIDFSDGICYYSNAYGDLYTIEL